jgi:hypothetical protein
VATIVLTASAMISQKTAAVSGSTYLGTTILLIGTS